MNTLSQGNIDNHFFNKQLYQKEYFLSSRQVLSFRIVPDNNEKRRGNPRQNVVELRCETKPATKQSKGDLS